MAQVRNISDRDLTFAGVTFPVGEATDLADDLAAVLLGTVKDDEGGAVFAANPNFEAVQAQKSKAAKGSADTDNAQEG